MCNHKWKRINDVDFCIKCGLSVTEGKYLLVDKRLIQKLGKKVKAK